MHARTRMKWVIGAGGLIALGALGLAEGARADAPPCRYLVGMETVLDQATNLTWRQTTSGVMKYDDAIKNCNELGGGFRLPTVKELQSIVDVTRAAPAIDSNWFPGLPSGSSPYWTATPRAANEADAWYVDFVNGTVYWLPKMTLMSVRCVKGP